jgi:hypothetical protein
MQNMKPKSLLFLIALTPALCLAQKHPAPSRTETEASVTCFYLVPPAPVTPFGFAKSTLASLWYARDSAELGKKIPEETKDADNFFALKTALMRVAKTSTNDFLCAKNAIKPYAAKELGENISTAAQFFGMIYDQDIALNDRLIEVIKKLDSGKQDDLSDEFSTLQVERGERDADLVMPATLAMASLIDLKRNDENGHASILAITKAQKEELVDWANEHFPEFNDETPQDKWSDPAKTAHLLFKVLDGRTCSDEAKLSK